MGTLAAADVRIELEDSFGVTRRQAAGDHQVPGLCVVKADEENWGVEMQCNPVDNLAMSG